MARIAAAEDLSGAEMRAATEAMIDGRCSDQEVALLLSGLRLKGETVPEIVGAASALRARMRRIQTSRRDVVDTCGTGGDAMGTFNISTAAAIVTAAAGTPVAKHGNRAVTSRSGSADVLRVLGVNVEAELPVVEACLDELGLCFCYAPLWHDSMRNVAEVRRRLGVPTIFNLLGPLANPAGAAFQLIGVGEDARRGQLAAALAELGTSRALVVRGEDGLDELTLAGVTRASEVQSRAACQATEGSSESPSAMTVSEFTWRPGDFGLEQSPLDAIRVAGPDESAAMIRSVLVGDPGPPRDIVVLNAAAALWTAGRDASPARCAELAAEAIDSGAAGELLARLVERSQR